jgi:hypothetical protein
LLALPKMSISTIVVVESSLSFIEVVFAIALFKWKKWGFYGLIASSVATFIILTTTPDLNTSASLLGFVGLTILYMLLNIGGENKAWSQLE